MTTTRVTVDPSDIADSRLAERGRRRTDWAERQMPVLRQVRADASPRIPRWRGPRFLVAPVDH